MSSIHAPIADQPRKNLLGAPWVEADCRSKRRDRELLFLSLISSIRALAPSMVEMTANYTGRDRRRRRRCRAIGVIYAFARIGAVVSVRVERRMMFDWLITGQRAPSNPASAELRSPISR
jgi:hypothetical protein